MREIADSDRIRRFMAHLGLEDDAETRVYFTGGATAVLLDWHKSTIDVDILIVPENDRLLRAILWLKEELRINVELTSPQDFIPVPPGWESRSLFIGSEGKIAFYQTSLVEGLRRTVEWFRS